MNRAMTILLTHMRMIVIPSNVMQSKYCWRAASDQLNQIINR
jgi:hypothetical protein